MRHPQLCDIADLLATKDAKDIKGSNDKSLCGLCCEKENYDVRELIPAVERGERVLERKISNRDRAVGAALSGIRISARIGHRDVFIADMRTGFRSVRPSNPSYR